MTNPSAPDGCAKDKAWLAVVFEQHDLNRDGRLTLGEFIRLARCLDNSMSAEECATVFDRLDWGHLGAIEFDPFFDWWTRGH